MPLRPALAALAFAVLSGVVFAQEPAVIELHCRIPGTEDGWDRQACDEYPDHAEALDVFRREFSDANDLMLRGGAELPDLPRITGRDGPALMLKVEPQSGGPDFEFSEDKKSVSISPSLTAERAHTYQNLIDFPNWSVMETLANSDREFRNFCQLWFLAPVGTALETLNYERVTGRTFRDRLIEVGRLPRWDVSLHIPEDRVASDRLVAGRASTECETVYRDGKLGYRDDTPIGRWGIFYQDLAMEILGGHRDLEGIALVLFGLNYMLPLLQPSAAGGGPTDDRKAAVVGFDRALKEYHAGGLSHFYPEVISTYLDPEAHPPGVYWKRVIRESIPVGETRTYEDEEVEPLATNAYALDIEPTPEADRIRRVIVEAELHEEWADDVDDLHLIVNGEVYSEGPIAFSEGASRRIRAVVDLEGNEKVRLGIGAAQAPEDLTLANADDKLHWMRYDLHVSVVLLGLCKPELFNEFMHPRMLETVDAFGTALGGGRPGQTASELNAIIGGLASIAGGGKGPTTGDLSLVAGSIGASGRICVDHLAVNNAGEPILAFFTPAPGSILGGGFDPMGVAHEGWEGWPPNSRAQVFVRLPGVGVDDLEAGRSYRAVLEGPSSRGFLPLYGDYDGTFHDYIPYQEAFTGQSRYVGATSVTGRVIIEEAGGGVVRGRLVLIGRGEAVSIEHTMRDTSGDQPVFDRNTTAIEVPIRIEADFAAEATVEGQRVVRGAGYYRTTVLD